jgi:polysaccharide biosynthesis protein PslJ
MTAVVTAAARAEADATRRELPMWPFALPFLGYPVAWLLGIGDLVFVVAAIACVTVSVRRGVRWRVPRGAGLWLGFLGLVFASVIMIDTPGRLTGWAYRALLYVAVTLVAVYVYNARERVTTQRVFAVLTGFWGVVVAGGWIAVLFPLLQVETPMAWVLPQSLLANDLVGDIAVRSVSQYNPDSLLGLSPRPSAPFLYTNGWGMAYALLLPAVLVYLSRVRGTRRAWAIAIALPLSLVPALLTLNRGMFIGIGVIVLYAGLRFALRRDGRGIAALVGVAAVALIGFGVLPIEEMLSYRLSVSSTTSDRWGLYLETFQRTLASPLFGYGGPRPSETPGWASAGTQGQVWLVMFSQGFLALALFVLTFVGTFLRTIARRDLAAIALGATLLAFCVQIMFYGALASGLAIALVAAATLLRPNDEAEAPRARRVGLIGRGLAA